MNERIQELAEQIDPVATIGNWGRVEWSDNVYPQLGDKMYAAIDLQKFAELMCKKMVAIEREACAKLCEQSDRYRGEYFASKIRERGDL